MRDLAGAAREARAWACYDCGKCTASCPLARAGASYSPRRHVLLANLGQGGVLAADETLFECLTCGRCDALCPSRVAYGGLVQNLRELAYREGRETECPHGGALQSVMRMMAKGGTEQDRTAWKGPDLKTEAERGEVLYWTGCTMYFDVLFADLGVSTLGGTKAAVALMNRLGVSPVVSAEERCCGHDLLWNGDRKNFEALAKHNAELIRRTGAETLVTSCAECLRTLKVDYEPFFEGKAPRMLHVTEYLAENLGGLKLRADGFGRATYQDPCRLGRHLGIYDAPRRVIAALPGVEAVEMGRSGRRSLCCAGGTWSNCDRIAKKIQVDRLREARATGADVLLTACPKCRVHFACAMKDPNLEGEIRMEMKDVAEAVLGAVET